MLLIICCLCVRKQLELQEGQQKIWDEELAPSQAGEDTPACQTIVNRCMDRIWEISTRAVIDISRAGRGGHQQVTVVISMQE